MVASIQIPNFSKDGATKYRPPQHRFVYVGPGQVRVAEVRPAKVCYAQVRVAQVRPGQVRVDEVRLADVRPA
jgi:hypothetical protein